MSKITKLHKKKIIKTQCKILIKIDEILRKIITQICKKIQVIEILRNKIILKTNNNKNNNKFYKKNKIISNRKMIETITSKKINNKIIKKILPQLMKKKIIHLNNTMT